MATPTPWSRPGGRRTGTGAFSSDGARLSRNCPDPRVYLGQALLQEDRLDEAKATLRTAWELTRRLSDPERRRPIIELLAASLLQVLAHGAPEEALPYVEEALQWRLWHPNVMYQCGMAYERLAARSPCGESELRAAVRAYQRGRSWRGVPLVALLPEVQERLLPLRLGIVLGELGEFREALEVLSPALEARPRDPALRVAAAEALCALRRPAAALQLVEPVLARTLRILGGIAADAATRLGEPELAKRFLVQAQRTQRAGEHHRRRRARKLMEELSPMAMDVDDHPVHDRQERRAVA